MNHPTILITGISSTVGKALLPRLSTKFHLLLLYHSRPIKTPTKADLIQADLTDIHSVSRGLAGYDHIDTIIHLAGVTEANVNLQGRDLKDNITMARTITRITKDKNVTRLIFLSSHSVDYSSRLYASTKKDAEELLAKIGIPLTIFRPSLILSPTSPELTLITRYLGHLPFLPIVGQGKTRLQPISASDVAEAINLSLNNKKAFGQTYTLAGPEPITQKQLLVGLLPRLGKIPTISIPIPLAKSLLDLIVLLHIGQFAPLKQELFTDMPANSSLAQKDLHWKPTDPFSDLHS